MALELAVVATERDVFVDGRRLLRKEEDMVIEQDALDRRGAFRVELAEPHAPHFGPERAGQTADVETFGGRVFGGRRIGGGGSHGA